MKLYLLLLACLGASLAAPQPHIQAKKVSPRSLLDDALEFVDLLPLDDLKKILDDHVANDAAVAYVITYLQGDDWFKLYHEIISLPTAEKFINYLDDAGIPVENILYEIHAKIYDAQPGVEPDQTASLRPFLDEIEADIPVDKLVDLLDDKMQNSPDFQDMYTTFSSEKGRILVNVVLSLQESRRIQEQLTAMEVDVAGALKIVYDFFNWGAPPK